LIVGFGYLDLEALSFADERSKLSQALFPRSADTN
jgi:hypothetical protein